MSSPARGEVWIVNFGVEGKTRPGVVLSVSPDAADRPLFAVVPRTTKRWNNPYEVQAAMKFPQPGVFNVQGLAPLPRRDFVRYVATMSADDLARVEAAVRLWLGL